MNDFTSSEVAYKGSKEMSLEDIPVSKATGFTAAADDYRERGIDLNEQLITNKLATFFFRMNGDAMVEAGIYNDDILVVDRSLSAINGKIIIAAFDGELLVRRLEKAEGKISLLAGNKNYSSIAVAEWNSYAVWGVVTYAIHNV